MGNRFRVGFCLEDVTRIFQPGAKTSEILDNAIVDQYHRSRDMWVGVLCVCRSVCRPSCMADANRTANRGID